MPWERLKRVGYSEFWVTRGDGRDLEPDEIESLDEAITRDLRFDYAENEVKFYFDPDTWSGSLHCVVYEPLEGESDDDEQ